MLTILQSTPKDNVETEIITGNYGFRVHAAKASKIVIDDVKAISEALGDKVAKRYLEGINPCDKYMISQSAKYSKDLEKFMKGVITVAGSTGFNK